MLGDYVGIVVCDGYAVYDWLSKQRRCIALVHCWAHVRRKFIEVDPNHPEAHAEVLDLIDKLFEIERRARAGPVVPAELLQTRQTESKPVVAHIHQWALSQQVLPSSALGKAIAYTSSLWKGLTAFLENPVIPLHHNATERGLRGVVVGRKNHYGSRSQRGTEVAALFYASLRQPSSLAPTRSTTCSAPLKPRYAANRFRSPSARRSPSALERERASADTRVRHVPRLWSRRGEELPSMASSRKRGTSAPRWTRQQVRLRRECDRGHAQRNGRLLAAELEPPSNLGAPRAESDA